MGKKLARKTLVPGADGIRFYDVGSEPSASVAKRMGAHLFEGYDPDAEPEQVDLVANPGAGVASAVLDAVGDDPSKAATALEAEQGRGDDARSTLIGKLEKIAAGANTSATSGGFGSSDSGGQAQGGA